MKSQLILLGAPGSGKGTQAASLVEKFGYKHVSTGDLLRAEISKTSDLGRKVKAVMDSGDLVDDELVLELLKANTDLTNESYIFDGFPRNIKQAKALDDQVLCDAVSIAVYFDIDLNILVERIINRRVAESSGQIYNLITRPPKVEGKCDVSGEDLVHRKDDNEDTVRNRMDIFKSTITPVLDYYEAAGKLKKIDASKSSDEIMEQLTAILL